MDSTNNINHPTPASHDHPTIMQRMKDGASHMMHNMMHAVGLEHKPENSENNIRQENNSTTTSWERTNDSAATSWNETKDAAGRFLDPTSGYRGQERHEFGPSEWEIHREQEQAHLHENKALERQVAVTEKAVNMTENAKERAVNEDIKNHQELQGNIEIAQDIDRSAFNDANIASEKSREYSERAELKLQEGRNKAEEMWEKAKDRAQNEDFKNRQDYQTQIDKADEIFKAAQEEANKMIMKSDFLAEKAEHKREEGKFKAHNYVCHGIEDVKKYDNMYRADQTEANRCQEKSDYYADRAFEKLQHGKEKAECMCEKAKETAQNQAFKTKEVFQTDVDKANEVYRCAEKDFCKQQEKSDFYSNKAYDKRKEGEQRSANKEQDKANFYGNKSCGQMMDSSKHKTYRIEGH